MFIPFFDDTYDQLQLDPSSSISPDIPGFKKQPALEDQIHCVALVIDASTVDAVDAIKDVIQNIKEMQTVMNSLGKTHIGHVSWLAYIRFT